MSKSVLFYGINGIGLGHVARLSTLAKAVGRRRPSLKRFYYSNSPAARAGLKEGMLVQKVENAPTVGKSLTECHQMLRANGRPKVRMELIDPAGKTTNAVEVTKGNYMTAG